MNSKKKAQELFEKHVPDNYTNAVSDTQRYKMLGNGWTVDVIAHIFSFIEQKCSYENAS